RVLEQGDDVRVVLRGWLVVALALHLPEDAAVGAGRLLVHDEGQVRLPELLLAALDGLAQAEDAHALLPGERGVAAVPHGLRLGVARGAGQVVPRPAVGE